MTIKKPPVADATGGCSLVPIASVVRRNALATRPVIGLEGVVVCAIRPIAFIAPAYMRIAPVDTGWRPVIGKSSSYDGARSEGRKREPEIAVAAIAWPWMAIAPVSAPVITVSTPINSFTPPLYLLDVAGQGLALRHVDGG